MLSAFVLLVACDLLQHPATRHQPHTCYSLTRNTIMTCRTPLHDIHAHTPFHQVTFHSLGGHSSLPPTDGSSIGAQLGRFLSAMHSRPAPVKLVPPTSDFVAAMADLAPGEQTILVYLLGVCVCYSRCCRIDQEWWKSCHTKGLHKVQAPVSHAFNTTVPDCYQNVIV